MCIRDRDGYEDPFGDVTVNLSVAPPNYCGYLNVNDMPDIEKFITENDIGEFTGFTPRSGFCEYPLYLFNVDTVAYTHRKQQYAPKQPGDEWHPLFVEALQRESYIEYLLDILLYGTPEEKKALVLSLIHICNIK